MSSFLYLYSVRPRWLIFPLLFICFISFGKAGSYIYDYNDNCSKAYQGYMALHFAEGRAAIITEIKANPYNLMPTYIADYEDCLTLLLNCDKEEYEQRKDHFESRLDLLDKGDRSSPWYRFCKAGLYLHWAIVNTRFGEQYKAAIKFRKSFALLKENQKLFPDFEYNEVFAGLQEAVIGSLPGNYQWLASVFGIKGNLKKGTAKLSAFINTHTSRQPLYAETVLYNAYTRFYLLNEHREIWDFLTSAKFPTANNLLNSFVKTNLALDYCKADVAMEVLQQAARDANYSYYPIFDYQMGIALLTKADIACTNYFEEYLKKNKSDLYIKECWQKCAWAWYINGNIKQAEHCREQIKLQGSTRLDADKQAEKFAEGRSWPVKKILQARLLTDGGYPAQAITVMNTLDATSLTNPADKAEYYYRLARAYEESAENKKALEYYQAAINIGKERHEQFAARAALQMGVIYERSGIKSNALQAKAGINRVEVN
jgi:tetratricopeptide (TPR) repeat protein